MDARDEHVGALTENLGGPVAVMYIPVNDHHPFQPELGDRQLGADRDVVEQAEPHRPVAVGVMA